MEDPLLEEEFRRLKKRDLFQTYFFKMACRAFGPPKCRERLTVAPLMPKFTVPVHRAPPVPAEVSAKGSARREPSYTGEGGAELAEWIRERRALRGALDRLGELDGWLDSKPTLTELEYEVMDRRRETRKSPAAPLHLSDMGKQGAMQDEEVLASLKMVRMGSETHSYPSTLGGHTGKAVESFRRQSLREYLDSLEQCQQHKLPISPTTLQRVFLHPGDASGCKGLALRQVSSSAFLGCGERLRGQVSYSNSSQKGKKEENEEEQESTLHKVHRERSRRQPLTRRADPNAFWPGHDGHVQLYQPVMSNHPESALFQLVVHTPTPSPGHWPVNQAGYFTSGDISAHKTYIL
ncbi:EF-hand calcium-binding domain-containing protein 12 [Colossoma macropomum]|uniref:EF-hand calcium-binding domain-containing protein 12 n=1 Tax=Colossoma macropomum TaxID=42526 RepID=UPI001864B2E7|nr:EF-hand calcium-binding domain-containing protein 12 [Colossoma macropomum]